MEGTTRNKKRARPPLTERRGGVDRLAVGLAVCGALSYGVTVVVGEDLADASIGPTTALGVRFALGALLLAAVLEIRGVGVFRSRRGMLVGAVLGAVYAVESTLFFSSLERMSAAATALVFYVYPAMVTVVDLLRGRESPHRATFVALALSTGGTAIVVAGGGRVDVTAAGVAFALAAAATFSLYLLAGRQLSEGADPMVIACWVSIAAAAVNLGRGAVQRDLVDPTTRLWELGLYGLATALAFTLTFAAMHRIGASRVAVIMTLEAVASVVMAAVFLGERIRAVQALGGAAVLGAAVVIALAQPSVPTATADAPDAGP